MQDIFTYLNEDLNDLCLMKVKYSEQQKFFTAHTKILVPTFVLVGCLSAFCLHHRHFNSSSLEVIRK